MRRYRCRVSRIQALVRHRVASDAQRDSSLVWRAASEGRPLELAKRLRLGVMAGGADRKSASGGALLDSKQAAAANGHDGCAALLGRSIAKEVNRRAIYAGDKKGDPTSVWTCMVS